MVTMVTFSGFRGPQPLKIIRSIGLIVLALLIIFVLVSANPPPPQIASEAVKEELWTAYQQRYEQFLASNADDPISDLFEARNCS